MSVVINIYQKYSISFVFFKSMMYFTSVKILTVNKYKHENFLDNNKKYLPFSDTIKVCLIKACYITSDRL
jgi:hypothetical protein